MVAKAGRYFGRLSKGYQGVTQGEPLSPIIFNVVVDVVILHWVKVVAPTEAVTGGLGLTIIDLAGYFYSNDGLVVSTQTERLQRAFYILTGLFNQVVICTNTAKTVGMVCQPYHAPGGMSEEAYASWATGQGPTFRECQWRRVDILECGVEVEAGFILTRR